MSERENGRRTATWWLLGLLVVVSLARSASPAWAAGPGTGGQPPTPQAWEWSPALGPDGQSLALSPANTLVDPAPSQPAEALTDRSFWIVLALVVLGSIVLMADFPDPN